MLRIVWTLLFSSAVNGGTTQFLKPSIGILPRKSYFPLFGLLSAEGPSSLLAHVVNAEELQGNRVTQEAPVIYHLLFVDNSVQRRMRSRRKIEDVLQWYEDMQGNRERKNVSSSKGMREDAIIKGMKNNWDLLCI